MNTRMNKSRLTVLGLTGFLLSCLLAIPGTASSTTVNQWPIGVSFGSWPDDSEWKPVNALNDPDDNGTATAVTEFVGDTTNPGFYIAKSPGYLFFRMRVQYPGAVTVPTGTTPAAPFNSGSIFLLINKSDTPSGGTPA